METADEIHRSLAVRTDPLSRLFLMLATLALAGSLLLFSLGYAAQQFRTHRWNPLGAYPIQKVINRNHLVHLDGTVDVTAQKCAREREVKVRTSLIWLPVNRPELFVPAVKGGQSVRYRSCGPSPTQSSFGYHTPIPDGVRAAVAEGLHIWRIAGTETPYDDHGREGVPRAWTTETFTIQ